MQAHPAVGSILSREAWLQAEVSSIGEKGSAEAALDHRQRRGAERILHVHRHILGLDARVERHLAVERAFEGEADRARPEAPFQFVPFVGHVLEIALDRCVVDAALLLDLGARQDDARVAEITRGGDGKVREKPVGEQVGPVGADGAVAVVDVDHRVVEEFEVERVGAKVEREREAVVGRSVVVDFTVKIVKIKAIGDAVLIFEHFQQRFERRAAERHHPRSVLMRTFDEGARGQQAQAHRALVLAAVAVFIIDVEHRADAPAVGRRKPALVEPHVLDGVRVEGGEKAEDVGGVVDGRSVEQHERLAGIAAPDVEAARIVGGRFDARQELQRPKDVGLEYRRQLFDRRDLHLGHADVARLFVRRPIRRDDHLVEDHGLRHEFDVEPSALARRQRHLLPKRLVADVGADDGVGPRLQVGHRVIARGIRRHPFSRACQHDVGQQQRLFRGSILHKAAQRGRLLPESQRRPAQAQGE